MSKKFTEEQYQKIVDLQKSSYSWSILEEFTDFSFWQSLISVDKKLTGFIHENNLQDELAAIANPLTREWAHDKFVEKEKKYYWTSKKQDGVNDVVVLRKFDTNMVIGQPKNIKEPVLRNIEFCLSESEIREWGYNPEMFNKEEV